MKIGIIGINMYVRALNYACPLHVYAFQQFLAKHGIESTIIDYLPNTNKFEKGYDPRHPSIYFENKVAALTAELEELKSKKNVSADKIEEWEKKIKIAARHFNNNKRLYQERELRYDKQNEFVKKYLKITDKQYTSALLEIIDPGFDCYICVTDIIWDKFKAMGYEPGFYLALSSMENKWKIAYSASKWRVETEDDRNLTAGWIKDMDYVSVREEFMQKEVQQIVRPDVTRVLDPVLLHNGKFYNNLIKKPKERNYLLLYYVIEDNPKIIKEAVKFAEKNNLKIIELTDNLSQNKLTINSKAEAKYSYETGIQEWMGYIRYAKYVFTNSFHGTCLSILFEKNFYATRRDNYDKITALLEEFGLQDRILNGQSIDDIPKRILNWKNVREKMEIRRKESEYFLLNAITTASQQPHSYKDYSEDKKKQIYLMLYNIGLRLKSVQDNIIPEYQKYSDSILVRQNTIEFSQGKIENNSSSIFSENVFKAEGYRFIGWRLRVHIDYHKFYLLQDGSYQEISEYEKMPRMPLRIFLPGESIPYIPLNRIQVCVAEAVWESESIISES